MSSDKQDASPEQQKRDILELAEELGIDIGDRWYFDGGISGDTEQERPDFMRLHEDAEAGLFECVVCWHTNRYSRLDPFDTIGYYNRLRKAKVSIATCDKGREIDFDDFGTQVTLLVEQRSNNQFLKDLGAAVTRGKLDYARRGELTQLCPYGFDRVYYDEQGKEVHRVPFGEKFVKPKNWRVRYREAADGSAEIVRRIFQEFLDDPQATVYSVTTMLNAEGIPSPRGGMWPHQTVRRMLGNAIYTGMAVYGKEATGKYHHVYNGERRAGPGRGKRSEELICVADIHDTIIDQATFSKASAKLTALSRTKRRRSQKYLLTGMITCGACGGPMCGRKTSGGTKYEATYYICQNASRTPGSCKTYSIQTRLIEGYVIGKLQEAVLNPAAIAQIEAEVLEQPDENPSLRRREAKLQDQAKKLDARIKRGARRLLDVPDAVFAELAAELEDLKAKRKTIDGEIAALNREAADKPSPKIMAAKVKDRLRCLAEVFERASVDEKRPIIAELVSDIRLWFKDNGRARNRDFVRGELELTPFFFDKGPTG